MKNRVPVLLVFVFTIIIILFSGCTANEYKQITKTREGITFSFECPVSYQEQLYYGSNSIVVLLRPGTENLTSVYLDANTSFVILITDPTGENRDAKTKLENLIEIWSNLPSFHEYQFIERSDIVVSGIQGELFVCSLKGLEAGTDMLFPFPSIIRKIYLDYDDKIVEISMDCYPEMAEQVEEEFEHIINSFKFLN